MDHRQETKKDLAQEIVHLRRRVCELEYVEEALQNSQSRFQALFENMGSAVALYKAEQNGEDFVLIDLNEAAEKIEQKSRNEAIGKSVLKVFPGAKESGLFEVFQRVWRTGRAVHYPVSQYKDNKIEAWPEDFVCRLSPEEIIAIYSDETERKRTEDALERRILALTLPLDQAETIAFEDLFNLDEIQKLQDQFAKAVGVGSLITRPDGTPITKPSNFCRLCREIIRKTEKGLMNCHLSDSVIGRYHPDGPNIESCLSAGLSNAGTSITVGGRHIANWLIGQVRNEIQDADTMRAYARTIGADEEAFMEAYIEVPYMTQEQFADVAQALFTLGAQLSTMAYQNVQQARFIAERRQAEDALRQSEERYRALYEDNPSMYFTMDAQGTVLSVNQFGASELGYRGDELVGQPVLMVFHPDDREAVRQQFAACLQNPMQVVHWEFRKVRKDGSILWVKEVARSILDVEGNPVVLVVCENITEQKKAEDELRAERERFQMLSDRAPFGMVMIAKDGTFEYVNPKFQEIFGYDLSDVPNGREWLKKAHPDDAYRHRVIAAWKEDLKGLAPGRQGSRVFEVTCKDGSQRIIHFMAVKLGTGQDLMTCEDISDRRRAEEALRRAHDELEDRVKESTSELRETNEQLKREIAERKEAENALRLSEEKYRLLVDEAPIGIVSVDAQGRVVEVNQRLVEMLGSPSADATKAINVLSFELLVAAGVSHVFRNCLERGTAQSAEMPYTSKWGKTVYLRTLVSPLFDENGDVIGCQAVMEDVSERKKAEEALLSARNELQHRVEERTAELKLSEEKYRTLFEESRDALYIASRDGRLIGANQAFLDLFGFTREEAENMDVLRLYVDPADRKRFKDDVERNGSLKDYEIRYRKKDGTVLECLDSSSLRLGKDGAILGYQGIVRDVTEHKQLQRQLLQAQKMEAIGILAGGIAHDFNNLLQVTMGYAEVLSSKKDKADPEYARLQQILQAGRSGAELVQRLLTLSRKTESKQRPIDLNHEIEHVRRLLDRTIPKMISIELRLEESLATVNADPTQIEQIVMNLAVNARDAMPEGGKLTLSTENVTLDEDYCRVHPGAKPGRYVMLAISDTGSGMDKDILDRIFEPFFTTKGVGRGTGLGLAMVYGIVKQHTGYVTCESQPSHGTVFKVYLPAIEEQETASEELAEEPKLPGGTETILLVDDEDVVRNLGELILCEAGYKILTARNGKEAIEIYRDERERISLVILDLLMPEMGGRQCMQEMLKINPAIRVLVASGYTSGGTARDAVELGAKAFVNKPFNVAQLLQQVRTALD